MKLGLFTSGYQRNLLEHVFMDAQNFGYDYIELWGGRPHAYAPDLIGGEINQILRLIERYEMPVDIYTPEHNAYPYNFMIGSENQRRDAIEYLKLSMDVAKRLGAHSTLISPAHAGYATNYSEIWDRLTLSLKELTAYAEKIGQTIILEALTPFESNVCTSANDLKRAIDLVKSPNLKGMCDVVPAYVQHESIMGYADILGEHLSHFHIVDSDGVSDTHLLPGEGHIPLKELMGTLKQMHYEGTATIELVTAYINEPRLYAKKAIDYLRTLI